MEIWKAIEGTKGCIEVSNEGRVRSLLRGTPRILKTQVDNKGYHRIRVTIEREKMTFKVHREVAKAFIENPNNVPQVNHIDGNKGNNHYSNLEWCNNRQNVLYALHLRQGGEANGISNFTYTPKRVKGKYVKGRRYSGTFTKENNPNPPKAIYGCRLNETDYVKYFKSISEAEKEIGSRHITDVLKGKRSHTKGWRFWYAEGGDVYGNSCN